jgi:hypothetical protein
MICRGGASTFPHLIAFENVWKAPKNVLLTPIFRVLHNDKSF